MITTFTLNAAIDKVQYIDGFEVGKVNRVRKLSAEPGGKGNNVAKVARLLGSDVTASGFLGGDSGQFVHHQLKARRIISDPVWVLGQTREALNIIDKTKGTQTEILEPGPEVDADEWLKMQGMVKKLAEASEIVCFSGSLPRGLEPNAYADLIHIAKGAEALTILDTSGVGLTHGIENAPFMCKPNRDELTQLTGLMTHEVNEMAIAATEIIRRGVELVVVSLDKDGSLVVTATETWLVRPPQIEAVNTVGCGDALVGGIANYLEQLGHKPNDSEIIQAVIWGTAAAASNAMYPIAGHVNVMDMADLVKSVTVSSLY
ncbi:1-phosphofructokinase family hexose kinase [Paenibacillus alkaliterrae]|uniref:1-phosphofructokinase family hexose kinase n=1 Tax=Paenibacillus alkaliterrae TaxID=320909 RepID=UPI001F3F7433|nr:1-phosphofructokinase family hexose kinase [Paenibacillus alkaliterrae]MCF2941335.1 1-phosphofructokinase family hexose kinase [Paenibacillus alkaliterrae]